jgi:hypothetical protein
MMQVSARKSLLSIPTNVSEIYVSVKADENLNLGEETGADVRAREESEDIAGRHTGAR